MANINQKFGKRVRDLRDLKGWSQEELAARANISARSISNIERGVFSPTLETIQKLGKALKIKISNLCDI